MNEIRRIVNEIRPPRCPECGEELRYLVHESTEVVVYEFRVDYNGDVDYYEDDRYPLSSEDNGYFCPYCHSKLFRDEEDAKKFLMGEMDGR